MEWASQKYGKKDKIFKFCYREFEDAEYEDDESGQPVVVKDVVKKVRLSAITRSQPTFTRPSIRVFSSRSLLRRPSVLTLPPSPLFLLERGLRSFHGLLSCSPSKRFGPSSFSIFVFGANFGSPSVSVLWGSGRPARSFLKVALTGTFQGTTGMTASQRMPLA